ncbi:MAG: hypothetical protein C0407_13300 [Desulfobacca sp.]|nr:hypothetical protein [Desulfobacca sp.]
MDNRSVYLSLGREENLSRISKRVAGITVSAIKQMPVLAAKVPDAVSLGQGIPSFGTPDFVTESVIRALREDDRVGKYSLQPGLPELKTEISRYLSRTKGLTVDPDREIFVSCGSMEALAGAICTVVDRGDEVLVPSPNYASHIEQILFAEGLPIFVPLLEEEGWRVGYLYAPSTLIDQVLKIHDAFAICAPTVSQYGALAALRATNGQDGQGDLFIRSLVAALDKRRQLICRRLDRLPSLFSYQQPQGAYYIFPRIVPTQIKSIDLALRLLYEAKVISIPGSGFGPTGEGHMRFSFGGTEEEINLAFDRIEAWTAKAEI